MLQFEEKSPLQVSERCLPTGNGQMKYNENKGSKNGKDVR